MRKFIRGAFELEQNVTELNAYEEKHKKALEELIEWANDLGIGILMGTTDSDTYLCEFKIVGNTTSYCKGVLAELKTMLKDEWKKSKLSWQGSGTCY